MNDTIQGPEPKPAAPVAASKIVVKLKGARAVLSRWPQTAEEKADVEAQLKNLRRA